MSAIWGYPIVLKTEYGEIDVPLKDGSLIISETELHNVIKAKKNERDQDVRIRRIVREELAGAAVPCHCKGRCK